MPIYRRDLRFVDAAIRDAFVGLCSPFGIIPETSFILSGCVVTPGLTYSWTSGYIALQGEILPVLAGSITVPSGAFPSGYGVYWTVDISYDVNGNKQFYSGASFDTYEVRVGKLVYGAYPVDLSGNPHYMPYNAPKLQDVALAQIIAKEEAWQDVTLLNSWQQDILYTPIGYKKDLFGTIWLKGRAVHNAPFVSGTIFKLPTGYYDPNFDKLIVATSITSGSSNFQTLKIASNGDVSIFDANNLNVFLDGISFKI